MEIQNILYNLVFSRIHKNGLDLNLYSLDSKYSHYCTKTRRYYNEVTIADFSFMLSFCKIYFSYCTLS